MPKVVHIYQSTDEIDNIFDKAVTALNHAVQFFIMIQHQDSCAKIMAKKTYKILKDAENAQKGCTPDE